MGREDVAFYMSASVMNVARTLSRKPYDELSERARRQNVEQAIDIVTKLLNDERSVEQMRMFMRTH